MSKHVSSQTCGLLEASKWLKARHRSMRIQTGGRDVQFCWIFFAQIKWQQSGEDGKDALSI